MLTIYQDLAIPSRRAILAALLDGPKNVSEVVALTGQKQPNVSNHFAKMRLSKTVRAARNGREVYYGFASADVEEAVRSAIQSPPRVGETQSPCDAANAFAEWAMKGDEHECTEIVDRLMRNGATLIDLYEGLIGRTMALVGSRYERGEIDEANEHAASAICERLLARVASVQVPKRPNGMTAIVGCAPNNWHAIGVRMVADFMRLEGWKVAYLGPNVPSDAFVRACKELSPDVVLISVSSVSLDLAFDLVERLQQNVPGLPLAVGGTGMTSGADRFTKMGVETPGVSFHSIHEWLSRAVAHRS